MADSELSFIDTDAALTAALLAYLSLIVIERVWYAVFDKGAYDNADLGGNLGVIAISTTLRAVMTLALPLTFYAALAQFAVFDVPVVWWSWIIIFLAQELIWYVDHRLSHRVGFLWAIHHVHHSSQRLNFSTASRAFISDGMNRAVMAGVLALAGFDVVQFLVVMMIVDFLGIFSHSEAIRKLGWLDRHFATPANHRVHHATNPQYIDKNYGHVLMIFDKLFGTFEPEVEAPRFGVTEPLNTHNPVRIYGAGFAWLGRKMARADTAGQKLLCLIKPPEWEPESARLRDAPAE
jgi:sterol desaturase/sphingolipid hydroxylase (fatty acid hydroxylase superfamily)